MSSLTAAARTLVLLAGLGSLLGLGPHADATERGEGDRRADGIAASESSAFPTSGGGLPASGGVVLAPGRAVQVPGGAAADRPPARARDFHFTRAVYSSGFRSRFRYQPWATDFPKADRQFLIVLSKTLDLLDVSPTENPVRLDDPDLRRFPFLYMLEVGYMSLTEEEVQGLRRYLRAGGFLLVDDFWGPYEWQNFAEEMRRVLPERPIQELTLDHPLFHSYYDIEEILQVPNWGNGCRGGPTHEGPGSETPRIRGIFDDEGRLMVIINWNTDLGDAWEWSERPCYPFKFSNYAYKIAVNSIIYSMTH